jgi:tetratricopeptide (TPR) repeat protein/SAM-dependent methyltransferase
VNFSIRSLFKRGDPAIATTSVRLRAQQLLDEGIAAETSGALSDAMRCYREALAADPGFAVAHMSLGIALQAAGEQAAAIAAYRQAISTDPGYSAAHYNLALTYLQCGEYAQAEGVFRDALRLKNDFPEAWVGLGEALERLGRDTEALAAIERAIAQRSDYVGALLNSGLLLRRMGQHEAAIERFHRVLAIERDHHQAHYNLGLALHELGRHSAAAASYRRAMALQPDFVAAHANLASILQLDGRTPEALQVLFEAAALEPANAQLRQLLVDALPRVSLIHAGDRERGVLLSLCLDDNVSMHYLNAIIIGWLKADPGFSLLQESTRLGEDPFANAHAAIQSLLRDPLLLAALPRMTVIDVELERILMHVRRHVLLRFGSPLDSVASDAAVPAEFVCALARQCFYSGHAFFADEDEARRLTIVRDTIEAALRDATGDVRPLEPALQVLALYQSLHTLVGCERILNQPIIDWSVAFRPIVQEQLVHRRREQEIAEQMPMLTTIADGVSVSVRAQYEGNPYPRWVSVPHPKAESIEELERRLRPNQEIRVRPRPVSILVAGCGTGHHPIQIARKRPDAEILAIDLSMASLAYAARMTERLRIPNIKYRQGDILQLGNLEQRFAIVESCGVLHHLNDPVEGWRVLVNLLEPDGLMRIALYSEKARGGIRAAWDLVQSLGLPHTADGIRRCRHAIASLPDAHPARNVMTFEDFYTLDGCRDLVMHVCEHQFTIPRIGDSLDELGLQFLGFECADETRRRFSEMFPAGDPSRDLHAWHRLEEAYPETFKTMYTFWCCKN